MNPFTSPSSLSTSTNTGMSTRASGTYTLANQFPSEFRWDPLQFRRLANIRAQPCSCERLGVEGLPEQPEGRLPPSLGWHIRSRLRGEGQHSIKQYRLCCPKFGYVQMYHDTFKSLKTKWAWIWVLSILKGQKCIFFWFLVRKNSLLCKKTSENYFAG